MLLLTQGTNESNLGTFQKAALFGKYGTLDKKITFTFVCKLSRYQPRKRTKTEVIMNVLAL